MIGAAAFQRHIRAVAGALLLAIVAVAPLMADSYLTFQAATALSYLPALLGLVVITGLTGQIALGHGAFFALGAYSTAILMKTCGWPFAATLPVAGLLSFAVGVLLGLPSLRLRGHFLAVVTLGVAIAAPQLFKHFEVITNGARGLAVMLDEPPAWLPLDATRRNYLIALIVAVLCMATTRGITRSHIGSALRAIRDNEVVAASLGADVARLKVLAFAFSAALTGLGGSVFAVVIGFVAPENFGIGFAALLIIGLVLGGKESEWGAVIGCGLVVAIPWGAGKIDQTASGVVFAVVVIGATFLAPAGIVGIVAGLKRLSPSAMPTIAAQAARSESRQEDAC
ncbi:branched-chain amino acid ABC transporter permease [Bradyrhizobium sp. U87765 SZCCT0131]|uniref:branched-chain amino acid ABC transporter permease n=1 Tax=unclassified Bradyrhizobium TaxID=2631580 RepID=UPI001BA87BF3|nr:MULTISPECIES: branched-chain amino acid ABC transporter permease [unclassified Bradyrhizobium]MBR1218562.1 branched-chain amino acid ABC transporter permease [Bradyrhizobium sp. U87765 SZCCT0131]MBR1260492.1 branched-chain amino acid ABC transporter permease [Bradyrhizobium sp. U87765 SZCCT0134]MBR1304060.1 branched-chain amino acid ABC transporter permease [Bradyrhizobium sp. U87765 SZCCT0110]MBR1319666.1 branched-chain amino acid ABC transporter permease [Bradyrhizobium sp. U87765 SZCCT010